MSIEKPKTLGDIYIEVQKTYDSCKDFQTTYDDIKEYLLEYYSVPENRAEIDQSPHRGLSTEVAVDLLMPSVATYIRAYAKQVEVDNTK